MMTAKSGLLLRLLLVIVIPALACSLGGNTALPTDTPKPRPTAAPVATAAPTSAFATAPGPTPAGSTLDQVDDQLRQMFSGSLAFNAPSAMQLDQSLTIQLLISPSASPAQLATQIVEMGTVVTASVSVTPRMRAELHSADPNAFVIQALHADPEQILSASEPTEWRWTITAKKDGLQDLTLTVYRLVEYNGKDYWREVSYEHNIQVQVTFLQRLQGLPWEWLIGLVATGLLIPAVWRWVDQRQKKQPKRKR